MPASAARLAVLLSGSGRTLVNLLDHIDRGRLRAEIGLVIGSRDCRGLEHARIRRIPTALLPGRIDAGRLESALREHAIDFAALAGYLQLIEVPHPYRWRFANIHPALLPSFGGRGMYGSHVHRAVLDAGCKVSGCTAHLCDEAYDRGPILAQATCPVLEDDTPDSLAARVFELECAVYPEALGLLIDDRVRVDGRIARVRPA